MGKSPSNMAAKMLSDNKKNYLFRKVISSVRNITSAATEDCVFLTTWEVEGGKTVRSKSKSVFFNLFRWKTLCDFAEDVDQQIQRCKFHQTVEHRLHLGGNLHVTISSEWNKVDIRFWYVPENETELKPGKPGISLEFQEWDVLNQCMRESYELLGLDKLQSCIYQPVHQSVLEAMNCKECHPPNRFFQEPEVEQPKKQPVYNPKQSLLARSTHSS